jgi:steroid delta-isomerase-like uncharacterized protein
VSTRDTIRQGIDIFNRRDADAIAQRYAEDAVVHDPQYPEPLRGRDAIRNDIESWLRSFPDVQGEVRSVLEDGNTYAVEFTMTGSHQGPISTPEGEIQPSGKRLEMSLGQFGRIDGENKIIEERRYYDLAGLAGRLGATG